MVPEHVEHLEWSVRASSIRRSVNNLYLKHSPETVEAAVSSYVVELFGMVAKLENLVREHKEEPGLAVGYLDAKQQEIIKEGSWNVADQGAILHVQLQVVSE